MTNLTTMQEAFLDALFGEAEGDVRKAMDIAGYSKNTPQSHVINALAEEIIERARKFLGAHAAKAARKVTKLIDNPTELGASMSLAAAKDVLDRAGIVKREKVDVSGDFQNALFVLPPKNKD